MQVLKDEFVAIEKALTLLPHGWQFEMLPEETRNIISDADAAMLNIMARLKKDNLRIAGYMAKRREKIKN